MNVIFMGTPDFAVSTLRELVDNDFNVMRVYSQPDKPKGRGHKLMPTPVKEFALSKNIPVFQPVSLRDEGVISEIKELNPDVIVVVAYGKLLPKAVLDIPKKGCINVHGSLLPKYRGAAPIQWSVLNGDKVTGVTTMYMAEGMDTGDMLLKEETEIGENETSGELFERLKEIGAKLLVKTLNTLDDIVPEKQNEEEASLAPMIRKEMSVINFNDSAEKIKCLVNGLNPWPSTKATVNGKNVKIIEVRVSEENGEAGVFFEKNGKLFVYCGEKSLEIIMIQPENKKAMTGQSYLLGNPIKN